MFKKIWSIFKELFSNGFSVKNSNKNIVIKQKNINVNGDFLQEVHNEAKETKNKDPK